MPMLPQPPFVSTSYAVRIHAGEGALDALPREAGRAGARRVFVLCGRSVGADAALMARLRGLLEDRWAGCFDGIGKDAPLVDVLKAVEAARAAGADMLAAVGAGSVLKAARVVAILLAEHGPVDALVTQYPQGGAPVSPRLDAAKLPIVNILTAATSAQSRAGSALKSEGGGYRLEFFDPKTRPRAIFWDPQALATAPPAFALSTGVSVYWRALMNMGAWEQANPLVQASRRQAFELASRAVRQLADAARAASNAGAADTAGNADAAQAAGAGDAATVQARIDLCAAALLQNRDEDDGGRPFEAHWVAQVVYALAAAAFNLVERAGQAQTHAVLTAPAIRVFGHLRPEAALAMGAALDAGGSASSGNANAAGHAHSTESASRGDRSDSADPAAGIASAAAAAAASFQALGMPQRLRDLGIAHSQLDDIRRLSLRNFNADRSRRLAQYEDLLGEVLAQAW